MLFKIRAKGYFKTTYYHECSHCHGHSERATTDIDMEIEAVNEAEAREVLRKMISHEIGEQTEEFWPLNAKHWAAIVWEIEPYVYQLPETVLLERRGEPMLFDVRAY